MGFSDIDQPNAVRVVFVVDDNFLVSVGAISRERLLTCHYVL